MKEIPFQANGREFCKMGQIGVEARKEILYAYDEIPYSGIGNYTIEITCFMRTRLIIQFSGSCCWYKSECGD